MNTVASQLDWDRLASMAFSTVIDLDFRSETRGAHGEWIADPTKAQWAQIDARYDEPDHARLINPRARLYKDPADHPFFKANPVSAGHIVNIWNGASDDDKAQGMRWYADAHLIAQAISPDDPRKGAALLAAYSPQTSWPVNMLNALRAIHEGRAIGPGEGTITHDMQAAAQRAMSGLDLDQVLKSPKTNAFGHLIANGGDDPADRLGKVVIDRHAMSVAVGKRLTEDDIDGSPIGNSRYYEHVADQYRIAARRISKQEGHLVTPAQVQAATWLHQQDLNQDADGAGTSGAEIGRTVMGQKSWERWADASEGLPLHVGTTMEHIADPITPAEARGNSRAVSPVEFQRLAADGRAELRQMRAKKAPLTGLDRNWPQIKASTFRKVQDSWGGATIDPHTGEPLPDGADRYALSVKPQGLSTVSVPETASEAEFDDAMDRALAQFRPHLEPQSSYLGVFHDDDNHRIDIDPVTVVDTPQEVEAIGAYTHAIGGAYHFKTGDGYFPPHVGADMSNTAAVHWKGPGHWHSQAEAAQPGLTPAQQQELDSDDGDPELAGGLIGDQIELAAGEGWKNAWRHELRGPHGEWIKGASTADHALGREQGDPQKAYARLARLNNGYIWAAERTPELVGSQLANSIGDQLDLASEGWKDAWRGEARGPDGKWVSSPFRSSPGQFRSTPGARTGEERLTAMHEAAQRRQAAQVSIRASKLAAGRVTELKEQDKITGPQADEINKMLSELADLNKRMADLEESKEAAEHKTKLAGHAAVIAGSAAIAAIEAKMGVPDIFDILTAMGPATIQEIFDFFKRL